MADCARTLAGIRLTIESEGPSTWLNEPLIAVNWFEAKHPKLYTLYNALAAASVFKTGATLFFKGHVREVLRGPIERDTLLMVSYPSAFRFLELPAKRRFRLISPLRERAVQRFSFAFHRRIDGPRHFPFAVCREKGEPSPYGMVIANASRAELEALVPKARAAAKEEGCSLHYAGHHAASLCAGRRNARALPHETPALLLFRGPAESLRRLVQHPLFAELEARAALLKRVRV